MYSLIFYVLFSVLILVQCQEFHHEEKYPHDYTVLDKCTMKEIMEIRQNREHAAIKSRERLVKLKPKHGYEFNPPTVTVKRCNGYCRDRWSPMPTKTIPMKFIVHQIDVKNPKNLKCVSVTVHEHIACKCMCMKSAKDCKPSQKWIENSCLCQCKDKKLKESECKAQFGMDWYDEDCSCAYTQKILACPSGLKWDKNSCDCIPE